MINMTPVLVRGFTFWDKSMLPVDEFDERIRAVRSEMAKADLKALVIWGGGYHTNGDLGYIAGWPLGGSLLLLPEGAPVLFTPGTGRELYFQKMQTWINDISSAGGASGKMVAETLARRGVTGGRIGVVSLDALSAGGYANATDSLKAYELVPFDEAYQSIRVVKRPREVMTVRHALSIAQGAIEAGEKVFAEGGSSTAALVEAERVARLHGARDFRGLVNSTKGELRPFEGTSTARVEPLMLWVGIDHHGYWADATNAAAAPAGSAADVALKALIAALKPGRTAGEAAQAALKALPEDARNLAISYGFGSGIGLNLEEGPIVKPDSEEVISENMLLSVRVFAKTGDDATLAGAIVRVREHGAERI